MSNPTAAMVVIGDEILSGRTRDANMHYLAGELTAAGIDFTEARFIADDEDAIIATVNELRGKVTHLFTSGGIGPTHDDITADAIGKAFGKNVDIREDAKAILAEHYAKTGSELNAARLRMARIPDDARLIENPVSAAPGFALENTFVMAGVPSVFKAMVASVLPTLSGGAPLLSRNIDVDRGEGDVAATLASFAERFQHLSFGSYPYQRDGRYGTNLVLRGTDAAELDAVLKDLSEALAE